MSTGKRFTGRLAQGLAISLLGSLSFTAAAQSTPGWYMGLEGFYSDVDDIDGSLTLTTPTTGSVQNNNCIVPIDLLGAPIALPPQLLGGLCILGNNGSNTLVQGQSQTFASSVSADNGFGGGASFGYLFDGGLRPELNLRYDQNDIETITVAGTTSSSTAKLRALRLMANLWYDIPLGNWAPYFGGGLGLQNTEFSNGGSDADDNTLGFQAGAGLSYWFSNRTSLGLDYRFITAEEPDFENTDPNNGVRSNLQGEYKAHNIGASFRYAFGGTFLDTDGDGVTDRNDKCPDTPEGVKVYTDGCPIDLDKDGVPDYLDKCPNTPAGTPVDSNGCPFDSDGDGVPDHLDQCPGTPAGAKVDARGCPVDSDGDGVPDYLDKCPDSPAGTAVNAQGCSISDKDGDGIPDHLDKCPDSPAGQAVGPDGCPLDSDGDGIPDYLDECPNTPAGLKILPNGCALVGDCRRPRPGEAVDANGCALDQRFVLRGVKFEFDSDKLTAQAKLILNDVADTLAAYPGVKVEVQGHTDSLGTDAYNLGLSERRSIAVKRYLTGRGVAGGGLNPVGYGEAAPIADNSTETGQEENRRVEFRVID